MIRSILVSLIAIVAMATTAVGFCAVDASGCSPTSAATGGHNGTCPAHDTHQKPLRDHHCCQAPVFTSATDVHSDIASRLKNVGTSIKPVIIRSGVFVVADTAGYFLATRDERPRPPTVRVFIANRTLLL
jgi:hypothetical protein